MESAVPATEIPLAPIVETELGSPVQLAQATPEGYDPSYPIEYPGADFQGYYPTDGEVIAPPSDTPLQGLPESIIGGSTIGEPASSTSDSQSPDEPQAPAIPSVVIEDPNPAIVVPDTATTSKPANNGSMSKAEPEIPTLEPVTASANNQARSDKMSAKKMAMEKAERDAEAKMIKKLKQQMRAAELRAREAEEKALAIARQSSSDQKLSLIHISEPTRPY